MDRSLRTVSRLAAGASASLTRLRALCAHAGLSDLAVERQQAPVCFASDDRPLDALVFSSPSSPFRDVLVAGRWAPCAQGPSADVAQRFAAAIEQLRSEA